MSDNEIIYSNTPIFDGLAAQYGYSRLVAKKPVSTGSLFDRQRLNYFMGSRGDALQVADKGPERLSTGTTEEIRRDAGFVSKDFIDGLVRASEPDEQGTSEHFDWARRGKSVELSLKPTEEPTATYTTVLPGEVMKGLVSTGKIRRIVENIHPMDLVTKGSGVHEFVHGLIKKFKGLYPDVENLEVVNKDELDGTVTFMVREVVEPEKVELRVTVDPEEVEEVYGTFQGFVQNQVKEFSVLYPNANTTVSVSTETLFDGTVTVVVSGVLKDAEVWTPDEVAAFQNSLAERLATGGAFHIDPSVIDATPKESPIQNYSEFIAEMINLPLVARRIDDQTISVKPAGAIWPVVPTHSEQTDESVNAAPTSKTTIVNPQWILADEEPSDEE
jgi:hypothetical protein